MENTRRRYESPSIAVIELDASVLTLKESGPLPSGYERINFTDEECDDPA